MSGSGTASRPVSEPTAWCRSAALFTVVSTSGFAAGDPGRVAAQIVTGVGFIGAGAILHHGRTVQGLTTAASLWVAAAIGVAVGVGMLVMSTVTAALVFALLRFGPRVQPSPDDGTRIVDDR